MAADALTHTTRRSGGTRLWNRRSQALLGKALAYLVLSALCFAFLIPLLWMISTAFKTRGQTWAFPPVWIPQPVVLTHFANAFRVAPLGLYFRNTLNLVVWNIIGAALSDSAVAFGFARLRFRGREAMFMVLLATLMIPWEITLIPRFLLFKAIGWYNTHLPLIVPAFFGGAFHIFLLRQYMMTIPLELDDAACIDGCSRFQLWHRIIMPLCKPPLTIVVVYTFMGSWNAFMGPMIYLNDINKYPLAVGLAMFKDTYLGNTDWNALMAASLMAVIPCLIIYYLAQEHLIGGIASVGLKG